MTKTIALLGITKLLCYVFAIALFTLMIYHISKQSVRGENCVNDIYNGNYLFGANKKYPNQILAKNLIDTSNRLNIGGDSENKPMNTSKIVTNKANIISKFLQTNNSTIHGDSNRMDKIDQNSTNIMDKNNTIIIDQNSTHIIPQNSTIIIDQNSTNIIPKNSTIIIDQNRTSDEYIDSDTSLNNRDWAIKTNSAFDYNSKNDGATFELYCPFNYLFTALIVLFIFMLIRILIYGAICFFPTIVYYFPSSRKAKIASGLFNWLIVFSAFVMLILFLYMLIKMSYFEYLDEYELFFYTLDILTDNPVDRLYTSWFFNCTILVIIILCVSQVLQLMRIYFSIKKLNTTADYETLIDYEELISSH